MRKLFATLLFTMTFAPFAWGQTTAVTGTATDSQATPYIGGTWTVTLKNTSTSPPIWQGSTSFRTEYGGSLDSTGSLAVTLPSNTGTGAITVGGLKTTQWQFNICARDGGTCFVTAVTITGTSQSISASLVNSSRITFTDGEPNQPPCDSNQVIVSLGGTSWGCVATSAINVPAGSNTQVQFNDNGVGGGDPGLTYDKIYGALTVGNATASANECSLIDTNAGGPASSILKVKDSGGTTHDALCYNPGLNFMIVPSQTYTSTTFPGGLYFWQNPNATQGNTFIGITKNGDPGLLEPAVMFDRSMGLLLRSYIEITGTTNGINGKNGYYLTVPTNDSNMLGIFADVPAAMVVRNWPFSHNKETMLVGAHSFSGSTGVSKICNGTTTCAYTYAATVDGDSFWSPSTNTASTIAASTWDTSLGRSGPGVLYVGNGTVGDTSGAIKVGSYLTGSNCSSNASPAVCGSAAAGSVVIAAGATTVTVNTTAVTANSQIMVFPDETLGTKLGVTCNSTLATAASGLAITARTAATSFQISTLATVAVNPVCLSYTITN